MHPSIFDIRFRTTGTTRHSSSHSDSGPSILPLTQKCAFSAAGCGVTCSTVQPRSLSASGPLAHKTSTAAVHHTERSKDAARRFYPKLSDASPRPPPPSFWYLASAQALTRCPTLRRTCHTSAVGLLLVLCFELEPLLEPALHTDGDVSVVGKDTELACLRGLDRCAAE